jgi:hypothetical protein
MFAIPAFADSHDVRLCLFVKDVRTTTSTAGAYVPVQAMPVEVWVKSVGIFWNAGSLTTSSGGCINGVLSGIGVPESTEIELRSKMQSSSRELQDIPGDVYYWTYGNKAVSKGAAADFGDFFINESATPDYAHGAFLLWDSLGVVASEYSATLGATFPYLPMVIGWPQPNWSYGGAGRITIFKNHLSDLETVRHEFGHNVAANDATTSSGGSGDYCTDYTGGAFPAVAPPYTYKDLSYDSARGDCQHSVNSYEDANDAASEGFAEFFADLLAGACTFDPDNPHRLNFDGNNREGNVRRAFCDLVDSGSDNQAVAEKHLFYGATSGLLDLGAPPTTYASGLLPVYGGNAYFAAGTEVREQSLGFTAATATRLVTSMTYSLYDIESSNGHFCHSGHQCFELSDPATTWPSRRPTGVTGDWTDIILVGDNLYALYADSTSQRVEKTTYGTGGWDWVWKTVYQETLSSDPIKKIAVDPSDSKLVMMRSGQIDSCNLPGSGPPKMLMHACASGGKQIYSGSSSDTGYERGGRRKTKWYLLSSIRFYGSTLYVQDYYGIARLDSTGESSQVVGSGADRIFPNNLHPRSLDITAGTVISFATDGAQSFFKADVNSWSESREQAVETHFYRYDEGVPVTEEIYCGADTVTKPVADVVRAYRGGNFSASIETALGYVSGLSSSEENAVKQANWISPVKSQECAWSGGSISESSSSGTVSSRSSASSADRLRPRDFGPGTPGWQEPRRQSGQVDTGSKSRPPERLGGVKVDRGGSKKRKLPQQEKLEFSGGR